MALIANTINSNQGLIKRVDLSNPDRQEIAKVLGKALRRYYMKTSVEWVTTHPDLYQSHFNLAASGIYGNTALLDFGDMSYVNLSISERNDYNFRQILESIGRDNNNSFIFGHGIYRHPRGLKLKEIVLNTLFLQSTNEEIEDKNRSRVILLDDNGKCKPKKLNLHQLGCTVQGTYFLCDGSTTDVSVLQVCAKEPFLSSDHFFESKRFIKTMQEALEERFGSKHFVVLGGVYTVNRMNNKPWKHKLIWNNWENKTNIHRWYCKVNAPETMITIFNSSTELHPINLQHPIKLNSCQSMHSLSHHSASVNFPVIRGHDWEEEYVGYFCPATTLYRIDEPPQRNSIHNVSINVRHCDAIFICA